MDYNPEVAPESVEWLELTELERLDIVKEFHSSSKIELPDADVHGAMHVIIENQIALGLQEVVDAMERLQKEGLTRHLSIHAIGTVLFEGMYNTVHSKEKNSGESVQNWYNESLKKLSAKEFHKRLIMMKDEK